MSGPVLTTAVLIYPSEQSEVNGVSGLQLWKLKLSLHHLRVVSQLISGGAGFRRNPFWLEARLTEIVLHVAYLPHHSPKRTLPRATSEGPAKFRNCRHLCLWLFAAIGEIDHCSPQSLMLFYTCVFQMAKRLIVLKKIQGVSLVVHWLRILLPMQDTDSIPGQGTKIPHAVEQLSPCTLEPMLHN